MQGSGWAASGGVRAGYGYNHVLAWLYSRCTALALALALPELTSALPAGWHAFAN